VCVCVCVCVEIRIDLVVQLMVQQTDNTVGMYTFWQAF